MFGLAAIAAVAAMAFVGATSASAEPTTLCTVDTENLECPANQASSVTFVSTKANSQLLNSTLNVSCTSTFNGEAEYVEEEKEGKKVKVYTTLGSPLVLLGKFTYTNCTTFCNVKEENGPATIEILKTAAELALVTGEGLVNVNCFGFFNCSYIGKGLEGHGLGGLETTVKHESGEVLLRAHVSFVKAPVENETGGSCPSGATLDALFVSSVDLFLRS